MPEPKTPAPKIALRVTEFSERSLPPDTYHITGTFLYWGVDRYPMASEPAEGWQRPGHDDYHTPDACKGLHSLRLYSQGNFDCRDSGLYAWLAEYYQPYSVDLPYATLMGQTLTKIDKAHRKARETDGDCSSLGLYFLRTARAVGATKMLLPDTWAMGGEMERTLADGAAHIDYLVRKFKEGRDMANPQG